MGQFAFGFGSFADDVQETYIPLQALEKTMLFWSFLVILSPVHGRLYLTLMDHLIYHIRVG